MKGCPGVTKELVFLRRLLYSETASAALPRTEDWYHRIYEYFLPFKI